MNSWTVNCVLIIEVSLNIRMYMLNKNNFCEPAVTSVNQL